MNNQPNDRLTGPASEHAAGYDVTAVTADAMFVPIVANAEIGTAHIVAAKTAQDRRFWEVRVIRASDGVIVRTYPTVAR